MVIRFSIGIDTFDPNNLTYCLVRNIDGKVDIINTKQMNEKDRFDEEVNNLSKYFNATVYKDIK